MKHLKAFLSLLLTLTLAAAFVPVAFGAAVLRNYSVEPGSSPDKIIVNIEYSAALDKGVTIVCVIDIDDSIRPKNGMNAEIQSSITADGIENKFTFEMNMPTRGPKEVGSWNAYFTIDGTDWVRAGPVSSSLPWEPNIVKVEEENVTSSPVVTLAGDVKPSEKPGSTAVTLDVTDQKIIIAKDEESDDPAPLYTIAGFSLDGGTKWKRGVPTVKDIETLFKKGGTLVLADRLDAKGKKPFTGTPAVKESKDTTAKDAEPSAVIMTFAKINPAPKAPKLTVVYDLLADPTGATTGSWTLADKAATGSEAAVVRDNLRVAWSKDGVKPILIGKEYILNEDKNDYILDDTTGFTFGKFGLSKKDASDGIEIAPTTGMKPGKQIYLIQLAATVESDKSITPASKITKLSVLDQIKAPALKADYKKETIKLKGGQTIVFGKGNADKTALAKSSADGLVAEAGKCAINLSKTDAGQPVLLTNYLDETETVVTVWTAATLKKPASVKQVLTLAPRAIMQETTLSPSKGKVKPAKTLEFYDESKNKYGAFPKVTSSYTGTARLKATAKMKKSGGYTGLAASRAGKLSVTWGKLTQNETNEGVLTATIALPAEYVPYVLRIEDPEDLLLATGTPYANEADANYLFTFPVVAGKSVEFNLQGETDVGGTVTQSYLNNEKTKIVTDISALTLVDKTTIKITVDATLTDEKSKAYAVLSKLSATLTIRVDDDAVVTKALDDVIATFLKNESNLELTGDSVKSSAVNGVSLSALIPSIPSDVTGSYTVTASVSGTKYKIDSNGTKLKAASADTEAAKDDVINLLLTVKKNGSEVVIRTIVLRVVSKPNTP